MKVAIVGFATEGKISAEYWAKKGADVTICDQATDIVIPSNFSQQTGVNYLKNLGSFDLIVRTAGLPPKLILEENPEVADKITTAVDEFIRSSPTKNIIGITGTKGKGTTSTLTAKILEAAGRKVWLGGNIGRSPLDFIEEIQPDDWVVLELSSFQLIDLKNSPHVAACLMVTSEHLNWHTDLTDYISAKSQLFQYQTTDDIAIYYAGNETSKGVAAAGQGKLIPYYESPMARIENDQVMIKDNVICHTTEIKLLGEHNLQNVCAAATIAWQAGVKNIDHIKQVITSFTGLEHRLEFVRNYYGINFYNDSFGTTPETAIVAIKAFKEPKIVILGGSDKGANYQELATTVKNGNVKKVLLIGEQAERIKNCLEMAGFTDYTNGGLNMEEIIKNSLDIATDGDVVLLSTACASFGMFRDYKDRGNQFKDVVNRLP